MELDAVEAELLVADARTEGAALSDWPEVVRYFIDGIAVCE